MQMNAKRVNIIVFFAFVGAPSGAQRVASDDFVPCAAEAAPTGR